MPLNQQTALAKFSRLRRRAATALESTRGLNDRVRELNDELRNIRATGVPEPSAAARATADGFVAERPATRRSRVASSEPPHRVDGGEWHRDPKHWIATWNEQQARAAAIIAELDDLETARDEASAEWQQVGALVTACREFLARNNIRVGA